jgi:transposase
MTSEMKQNELEWRRSKVLEYSSQGYSEREISEILKVNDTAVHRDLQYLRKQAQESLQHHIHEVLPEEYQKGMIGMKRNLKRVTEIGEASSDPKIKLEAIRIANDCHRFIMDLCTNAGIITDAMKFATKQQRDIDALQMLDERIAASTKEIEEEGLDETTTNGIF